MPRKIESCKTPINNLRLWKADVRVVSKLSNTGFDTFYNLSHVRENIDLLNAIVRTYNADVGCFEVGGAVKSNIFLGLEDITYLTGFPVDGDAVTGKNIEDPLLVCNKLLGMDGITRLQRKNKEVITSYVSLSWLRENFMNVPEDLGDESIARYVRAYVLYVIGCVIASQKDAAGVSIAFLPLLDDIEKIKDYAWGAALLAYLHSSLRNICRDVKPAKTLYGCALVLMSFALERIPQLASLFIVNTKTIRGFPLLVSWADVLNVTGRDNYKNHQVNVFEDILDNLQPDQICWQPYQSLPADFLPIHLRHQVILGMSRTILICFEHVMCHCPDVSPMQFGINESIPIFDDVLVKVKPLKGGGCRTRDWATFKSKGTDYEAYNRFWVQRHRSLINQGSYPEGSTPADVSTLTQDQQVDMTTPHQQKAGVEMATPHQQKAGVDMTTPHQQKAGVEMATPHQQKTGVDISLFCFDLVNVKKMVKHRKTKKDYTNSNRHKKTVYNHMKCLDQEKVDALKSWFKQGKDCAPPVDVGLEFIVDDAWDFFKNYLKLGQWLYTVNMDAAIKLFACRMESLPHGTFLENAILIPSPILFYFKGFWETFTTTVLEDLTWPPNFTRCALGKDGAPFNHCWTQDSTVFTVWNINNIHWVALAISLQDWCIRVYDSMIGVGGNESEIMMELNHIATMMPLALATLSAFDGYPRLSESMNVIRIDHNVVPRSHTENCGVYALMHLEHLITGTPFTKIVDENISYFRLRLAVDIFHQEIEDEGIIHASNSSHDDDDDDEEEKATTREPVFEDEGNRHKVSCPTEASLDAGLESQAVEASSDPALCKHDGGDVAYTCLNTESGGNEQEGMSEQCLSLEVSCPAEALLNVGLESKAVEDVSQPSAAATIQPDENELISLKEALLPTNTDLPMTNTEVEESFALVKQVRWNLTSSQSIQARTRAQQREKEAKEKEESLSVNVNGRQPKRKREGAQQREKQTSHVNFRQKRASKKHARYSP